jgi:hypothetical protein
MIGIRESYRIARPTRSLVGCGPPAPGARLRSGRPPTHARGERSGRSPSPSARRAAWLPSLPKSLSYPCPLSPPFSASQVRPRPRRCATHSRSPRSRLPPRPRRRSAPAPVVVLHLGALPACATPPRWCLLIGAPAELRRRPRPLYYTFAISPLGSDSSFRLPPSSFPTLCYIFSISPLSPSLRAPPLEPAPPSRVGPGPQSPRTHPPHDS